MKNVYDYERWLFSFAICIYPDFLMKFGLEEGPVFHGTRKLVIMPKPILAMLGLTSPSLTFPHSAQSRA
jgi:hypothetical protein